MGSGKWEVGTDHVDNSDAVWPVVGYVLVADHSLRAVSSATMSGCTEVMGG